VGRNRCLTCAVDEIVQTHGANDDADGADANRGAASIVSRCDPRRITRLVKLPKRSHAGVNAFPAAQHFTADARVFHTTTIGNDCARDGYRPLSVVCCLADLPFAFPIADVTRNDGPGGAFESPDAMRIPAQHVLARQEFGLFADGVASRDAFETTGDAVANRRYRKRQHRLYIPMTFTPNDHRAVAHTRDAHRRSAAGKVATASAVLSARAYGMLSAWAQPLTIVSL